MMDNRQFGWQTRTMTNTRPIPATRQETSCCIPTSQHTPDPAVSYALARKFKALSDPTRLQLLQLVAAHHGRKACICDLTAPLGVTQPTVSHHMRLLVEAGFVTPEESGKWTYYILQSEALGDLCEQLTRLGNILLGEVSPCSELSS